MIGVLSDDAVIGIAKKAMESTGESGRLNDNGPRILQFGKKAMEDGSTLVVIADSTSRYGLTRLIITYMAVLWFVVLVLFIIVMSRYSRKLVKPFIENDERQKRFITNASHELKTPLAVIGANNELTAAVSGKTKWTESTARQVKRLQLLIENLVALTRLDEMEERAMTDVDLSAAIIETADPFRSIIESSGRKYEFQVEQNVHVNGEKRTLQQIASILLDNAAKYCDEDGTVTVHLNRKGKGAQLSVSNTYAEGKTADTSRFFERFYREDESHNSAKPGFGIGLSMAKEMSERVKGKLSVCYSGETITFSVEIG
jgi:signal transduction histidine kinase